jgi:hypothetical protein
MNCSGEQYNVDVVELHVRFAVKSDRVARF